MCKLTVSQILLVSTIFFISVAFVHALRFAYQSMITISGVALPLELSVIAVLVLAYLAYESWKAIPKRTVKTKAQLVMGLFAFDAIFDAGFWFYGINFLGVSGLTWGYIIAFDLIVIGILYNYIRKKKR